MIKHNNSASAEWLNTITRSLPFMLIMLIISLLVFGPTGDDDGHITYTAAKNLAEHGVITNNNGDWVEQGSSLLHVILLAAFYTAIHYFSAISMANLGPIFSLLAGLICIPLIYHIAEKSQVKHPLLACLLTSLSTGFSYWAMGGLESTLVTLCFLLFVLAFTRYLETPQTKNLIALSLICLVTLCSRPEIFLVLVLFTCLFAFKQHPLNRRQLAYFISISTVLFICICVGRWLYYHQYFPQPVYAKAEGISLIKIAIGIYYFLYSKQLTLLLYALLTIPIFFASKKLPTLVLSSVCLCLAYLAFIINAGGDWMAGGRFFVPIIPLLIIAGLYQLQNLRFYRQGIIALSIISILEIIGFHFKLSAGIPLWEQSSFHKRYPHIQWDQYSWAETNNLVHARDIPAIEALIQIISPINKSTSIHVASIQMGMIPHHLRNHYGEKVDVIDIRGLTTQHISQCPQLAKFPKTWSGIAISYRDYFKVQEACQLPKPDIIYDLLNREHHINQDRLDSITEQGYTIVYMQKGKLMPSHGLKNVDIDTFIAVTPEVLAQLPKALHKIELQLKN